MLQRRYIFTSHAKCFIRCTCCTSSADVSKICGTWYTSCDTSWADVCDMLGGVIQRQYTISKKTISCRIVQDMQCLYHKEHAWSFYGHYCIRAYMCRRDPKSHESNGFRTRTLSCFCPYGVSSQFWASNQDKTVRVICCLDRNTGTCICVDSKQSNSCYNSRPPVPASTGNSCGLVCGLHVMSVSGDSNIKPCSVVLCICV